MQEIHPQLSRRHAFIVVAVALAGAAAAGYYAATTLGIDTDTADLLSRELPSRQVMSRFEAGFPQNRQDLVAVIECPTPEQADIAAEALVTRLQAMPGQFAHAHRPTGGPFFRQHGLLYQSPEQIERLGQRLARMQPLMAALESDPTLRGLLQPLGRLLSQSPMALEQLDTLLTQLDRVATAQIGGRAAMISWQHLMRGPTDQGDVARTTVIAQPRADYGRLLSTGDAIDALRQVGTEIGLDGARGGRLRVTGKSALAHAEMTSLMEGMAIGGPIAVLLVVAVLLMGFRSPVLVLASVVTLIIGLVLTAGFAALVVGRLNLISVAFALLYVGLGVDFAIHYGLRYRALHRRAQHRDVALHATGREMARTLTLCALTTAIGFLAFVPTAFTGVAELGIIAGGGMIISLVVTLTVLPALLLLAPDRVRAEMSPARIPVAMRWVIEAPARHRKTVIAAAAIIVTASAWLAPQVAFNTDPLDLREAESEAVRTRRDLRHANAGQPGAFALAGSPAQARTLSTALSALPEVERAITVFDLIPDQQHERLQQVTRLAMAIGTDWRLEPEPIDNGAQEQIAAVRVFQRSLSTEPNPSDARSRLRETLGRWLDTVESMTAADQQATVRDLQHRVLHTLPIAWERFTQALSAKPISLQALPSGLRSRWVSPDGTYRVEIQPSGDMESDAARRRFVDAIQAIAPDASGAIVIQVEAGRSVVGAFRFAMISASVGILVVLLAVMRDVRRSLTVLLPLVAGGVMTAATMVLLSIPLNFANVIALPLLLGVGVDNGVHMVQRSRRPLTARGGLLQTTTARSVLFSTITTLCSFGGLALSPHPGTASMGQVLTIGLVLIVGSTLVLLPAMLPPRREDIVTQPATHQIAE